MREHCANTAAPGSQPTSWSRTVRRWISSNNPFYVISALLVLCGLRMSVDPGAHAFPVWALVLGLAGYTLLMAATACLLARFNTVWEDVRTLLLLMVLMFLAISVLVDDVMVGDRSLGTACDLGGLAFALAVSEAVLRRMRVVLPLGYRLPYFLLMALFFVYLFAFLAFGVVARSWYLCLSTHYYVRPDQNYALQTSIFEPYFLVPFALALNVLLLEAGLTARSRRLRSAALVAPLAIVALAAVGHRPDPASRQFLDLFEVALGGSPLFLTLVGVGGFFVYATLRGLRLAPEAVAITAAALTVVGPGTRDLASLVAPQPVPLLAGGLLLAGLGIARRDSRRCVLAAACLVAGATSSLADTGLEAFQEAVAFHLALGAVLLIGAAFEDTLARLLRVVGAVLLFAACIATTCDEPCPMAGLPPQIRQVYPLLAAVTALAYGHLLRIPAYVAAGALGCAAWVAATGWHGYRTLRRVVLGLDQIAWGLAFFLLAAMVSLAKAGALSRWLARRAAREPQVLE